MGTSILIQQEARYEHQHAPPEAAPKSEPSERNSILAVSPWTLRYSTRTTQHGKPTTNSSWHSAAATKQASTYKGASRRQAGRHSHQVANSTCPKGQQQWGQAFLFNKSYIHWPILRPSRQHFTTGKALIRPPASDPSTEHELATVRQCYSTK